MSRIDELINELCIQGVEFKSLGELCSIQTGNQLNKEKLSDIGEYPVFNGGIYPSGFHNDFNTEANTIAISQGGASAGYVNWVDVPFFAGAHCYTIKNISKKVLNRYLYFFLKNEQNNIQNSKQGAGIPGLNRNVIKDLLIPIPPLPVQREIVQILDNFTELTAELTAELTVRKQQYDYYLNKMYEDLTKNKANLVKFHEIGIIERGNGLQKSDFVEKGVPCIHYGQIYTYFGTYTSKTKSFVSIELAKKLKKVKYGDIIIAVTSENIEDVCKSVLWLGDEEIVTGGHTGIFRHNQNPKYIAYFLKTKMFFEQKRKIAHGTKVIEVTPRKLENIVIPIPSQEEQQRIVDILDKFDKLVNDISEGIPAEIAARQKQYEYYRDKLLTFKEVGNESI